ncbi:hypothetical protein GQ44DRAFT_503902 [Phaeosphaeriaceae sp. PMI808]|nr:hypothetical protein GQ44DRAFT_503902 [Phaeosphaeriaceae sp. PMI808]
MRMLGTDCLLMDAADDAASHFAECVDRWMSWNHGPSFPLLFAIFVHRSSFTAHTHTLSLSRHHPTHPHPSLGHAEAMIGYSALWHASCQRATCPTDCLLSEHCAVNHSVGSFGGRMPGSWRSKSSNQNTPADATIKRPPALAPPTTGLSEMVLGGCSFVHSRPDRDFRHSPASA